MHVEVADDHFALRPALDEITDSLQTACAAFARASQHVGRPETHIFPDLVDANLCLSGVPEGDECVLAAQNVAQDMASANFAAPTEYLGQYSKYAQLLGPPGGMSEVIDLWNICVLMRFVHTHPYGFLNDDSRLRKLWRNF